MVRPSVSLVRALQYRLSAPPPVNARALTANTWPARAHAFAAQALTQSTAQALLMMVLLIAPSRSTRLARKMRYVTQLASVDRLITVRMSVMAAMVRFKSASVSANAMPL